MKTPAIERILKILQKAGSRGVTTWQIIDETRCSAAARRVWDLQQRGYRITKVDEGGGVYRWIYRGEPLPKPEPKPRLTAVTLLDLLREETQ